MTHPPLHAGETLLSLQVEGMKASQSVSSSSYSSHLCRNDVLVQEGPHQCEETGTAAARPKSVS